jgi:hypothetical protein
MPFSLRQGFFRHPDETLPILTRSVARSALRLAQGRKTESILSRIPSLLDPMNWFGKDVMLQSSRGAGGRLLCHFANYLACLLPPDFTSRAKSSFPCLRRNSAARWRSFASFDSRTSEYCRKKAARVGSSSKRASARWTSGCHGSRS